jgi:hypothetical protein
LAASALPLQAGMRPSRRVVAFVAAAVRCPRRVVALIVLLARTGSEQVVMSGSTSGEALRAYFNERALGIVPKNRLCRGVLLLPSDRSEYLRGRRRQAVRTNLRRAANAGITCEVLDDRSLAFDDAVRVCNGRRSRDPLTDAELSHLRSLLARPEVTLLAARSARGTPLAVAAAVIDEMACVVEWAVADSHEARWALHGHLVDVLIARGVRYVMVAGGSVFGALGFAPNAQHYQHLLGYELRHLNPMPAHPNPNAPSWRRLAVAGAAAATIGSTLFAPPAAASVTASRMSASSTAVTNDVMYAEAGDGAADGTAGPAARTRAGHDPP